MGANNEQEKQENLQADVEEQEVVEDTIDAQDETQPTSAETDTVADEASPDQEDAATQAQLEELRKELEEQQQRLVRMQADYDNFRRRTRQEKEDFAKYAASDVIEQLLPVLDNFGRALDAADSSNDFDALFKGVDMIFRQLQQVLEHNGLQEMDAVGQPFNPEYHEAVMKVEDTEHEEGIIVEQLQKGYMFKDKVLRPAMVKVSG